MNVAFFEALADLLIPSGAGMPSASEVKIGSTGLPQVLTFRPELEGPLEKIVAQCQGMSPQQALDSLDPGSFAIFAEIVASAYFMNEDVRAKLHYHGQRAQPIVPEEIDAALLKPVIDRGPIYRE